MLCVNCAGWPPSPQQPFGSVDQEVVVCCVSSLPLAPSSIASCLYWSDIWWMIHSDSSLAHHGSLCFHIDPDGPAQVVAEQLIQRYHPCHRTNRCAGHRDFPAAEPLGLDDFKPWPLYLFYKHKPCIKQWIQPCWLLMVIVWYMSLICGILLHAFNRSYSSGKQSHS